MIVAYNTVLQKVTPGPLMGRVSTATEVLVTTPQAISIAIGALLVTVFDYRLIFVLMTLGSLVAATYLGTALRGRLGPVAAVVDAPISDEEVSDVPASRLSGVPVPASPPGPDAPRPPV